jgi:hypothetical protein
MTEIKRKILLGSVARWRSDNPSPGVEKLAAVLERSMGKRQFEIPTFSNDETVEVLASSFRLAHRLSSPMLRSFWFNVGAQTFLQMVGPQLEYERLFSREDGQAPRCHGQRNTSTEQALQPRSYSECAQDGSGVGQA